MEGERVEERAHKLSFKAVIWEKGTFKHRRLTRQ